MKNKFQTILVLLFCALSWSQVKFEAEVSKNKLGVNENLRVDFKMNKDGDNFSPPSFNGFNIVGGPNQSVSNSWINGKRTFSKTYSYFLSPVKRGRFTIGQASIEIEGDIYKTSPVDIQVIEAVDSSASPNNTESSLVDDDIQLITEVSKRSPYLNEPISIVYKLFFSPEINVRNLGEIDSPEFKNFWSQKIDVPRLEIKRSSLNGKSYNYVTWKKTLLYPQKDGRLEINPMTLDVSIDVPTNRRDFFGNIIYTQTSSKVSSDKQIINVKSLPDENRPEDFAGAVGDFDISLSSNKTELKATESFQLELKVAGTGNLKLFSLPEIIVPSSLEKYDPEFKENVKIGLSGMNGNISNTYTIVPQFQGKYPIPIVKFSYFNPSSKKYVTIYSDEEIIDVYDGPIVSNENEKNVDPKINIPTNSLQFNFIDLKSDFNDIVTTTSLIDRFRYYLITIPIIIIILVLIYLRFIKDSISSDEKKSKLSRKLADSFLEIAKNDINNTDLFYISLEKALFNFLKSRFDFQTSEFSKDNIKVKLSDKNIDGHIIESLIEILKSCEYARYTPSSPKEMKADYEKAVEIIYNIEKS